MSDMEGEPDVPAAPAFILVPLNKSAEKAIADAKNGYLRTVSSTGKRGVYISFENEEKQEFTLGRSDTDIHLPDPRGSADISKHQCSFVCKPNTGAVLLVDHSNKGNTEPYSSSQGGTTIPIPKEKRSVLVARGINGQVAFGKGRYYEFRIEWISDGLYDFPNKDEAYDIGPATRRKKYLKGSYVGGGAFGSVFWAVDVVAGKLMAVKSFHYHDGKNIIFAKREVDNLIKINKSSSIPHSHIIEILDYSGGKPGDSLLEIMMPLMDGNLRVLVEKFPDMDFSHIVLRQMLLALKCLAQHSLIHRDVKPENILWEITSRGKYHLRLGDFGLSHDPNLARTVAGTEPFMAPEILNKEPQTEKVDIWSLFATMVWVRDIDNFRGGCSSKSVPEVQHWLLTLAERDELRDIRMMANLDPSNRPSAEDMLKILARQLAAAADDVEELADSLRTGLEIHDDQAGPIAEPTLSDLPNNYGDNDADHSQPYPQSPYYEPYSPNLDPETLNDIVGYNPPPPGFQPRQGGHNEDAWVVPYEPAYSPVEDSSSGTAVPEPWTTRRLPTKGAASSTNTDRKGKGKKR